MFPICVSTIDYIIQETIDILSTVDNYFISHVYRESNMVVDSLDNVVVRINNKMRWQGDMALPTEVISSINYDLINGKEGIILNNVDVT